MLQHILLEHLNRASDEHHEHYGQKRRGLKWFGAGSWNFSTDCCKFPTQEIWVFQISIFPLNSAKMGDSPSSPMSCIFGRKLSNGLKSGASPATTLLITVTSSGVAGPLAAQGGGQICRPFVSRFLKLESLFNAHVSHNVNSNISILVST